MRRLLMSFPAPSRNFGRPHGKALIGGGVFGNPLPLIWKCILWAAEQAVPLLPADLDVIVNGRNLGSEVSKEAIRAAVRQRDGALLVFGHAELPEVVR